MKLILPVLGMTVISFGRPKYLPLFPRIETIAGIRIFDWLWWRTVWMAAEVPTPGPTPRSAPVHREPVGTPAPPSPAGGTGPIYVLPWPPLLKLDTPPSSGQRCPLCHQHQPNNIEN